MPTISGLWTDQKENFFGERELKPLKQMGKHNISTVLAMLCAEKPELFQTASSQDPFSWSRSLEKYGMKLAYLPHETQKVHVYMDELISLNDLFLICYYARTCTVDDITRDPNTGFICPSHAVILHKDRVIDPKRGDLLKAKEHECMEAYAKRLFRVVPVSYKRGI